MSGLKIENAERLAHAYIISAQTAGESLQEAGRIAAALVCTSKDGQPCGKCRACRKAQSGIHPDIIKIGRLADDKGRLKREIGVEQVRQMRADACILPNEASRKVYIIDEADTMNAPAQNAALKLLEEPPNGAVFLLCVKNPRLLLPTVRSRCGEINLSGTVAEEDEASEKLAMSYLKAAASGDRTKLLGFCFKNEGIDTRETAAFVSAAGEIIADMLCLRRPDLGMSRAMLMRLSRLMTRCGSYLKVNVGVKHIFGLLAVDSIVRAEKEEI